MPKNVQFTSENDLKSVALPTHGSTYTVVSHDFIIQNTLQELQNLGFGIEKKVYTRNLNGEVAQGIYHLTYGNDPDMGLMFAWGNSYDKSMRFRCAVGAHVKISGSAIIAGDMSNYGRKHTGDAKEEVKEHIVQQLSNAAAYFKGLVADKTVMKTVTISDNEIGKLMGTLYFEKDILTSSQLINVKEEFKSPSYNYGTDKNNLWTVYNHIICALKKAHPKKWMEQQKDLHKVIKKSLFPPFAAVDPTVSPNQMNLEEGIAQAADDTIRTAISSMLMESYGSMLGFDYKVAGANLEVVVTDDEALNFVVALSDLCPDLDPADLTPVKCETAEILTEESLNETMVDLTLSNLEEELTAVNEFQPVEMTEEMKADEEADMMKTDEILNIVEMNGVPEDLHGLKETDTIGVSSLDIRTEEELNHELHGVDNNPEVVISSGSDFDIDNVPDFTIVETEMSVDEALETYPEHTSEIIEAAEAYVPKEGEIVETIEGEHEENDKAMKPNMDFEAEEEESIHRESGDLDFLKEENATEEEPVSEPETEETESEGETTLELPNFEF